MKSKGSVIVILTTILCCTLLVTSAWAGSKQRHRWEGVAIGIGAAMLGSALLNSYYYDQPPRPVYYRPRPLCYRPAPIYYGPVVVSYTEGPPRVVRCGTPYRVATWRYKPPPPPRRGSWA
ncbi:MAG: DUF4149 domain-containing protein, partial [Thermodesulfobacteriota bacterium]|nr:DUF4149 domain-containing protein [Thermodesulfobacteriota bacterium]